MTKLSATTVVGLFILVCVLAAMVSIAIMQVVRTVEDWRQDLYRGRSCCPRWRPHSFDVDHHDQAFEEAELGWKI